MNRWGRRKSEDSVPGAAVEQTAANKATHGSTPPDLPESRQIDDLSFVITTDEDEEIRPVSATTHARGPRAAISSWLRGASRLNSGLRRGGAAAANSVRHAARALGSARQRGLRSLVGGFLETASSSLRTARSRGARALTSAFFGGMLNTWRSARARRSRALVKRFLLYTVLFLFALWYLTPIYVLLVTSLKGSSEITLDKMWVLPNSFDLSSFSAAWQALSPNFINSLVLAIPAAILSSIVGSLNGYVLAKWRFRGSEVIFTLILFGMFIPYQAILIPLTQVMSHIGLYGSLQGLMLVHIIYGIPITTLIFRNYYAGIPTELLEAAKVDGAGFIRLYRSILLPLSASGFVVVLIWQFNSVWNDFLFAVTLIPSQTNWPITVALNNLSGSFVATWNVQMAGALIAATPTLLIFIILGRYFVRGLLAGSLKG
jgi:glucose/mannose transport system permease protein